MLSSAVQQLEFPCCSTTFSDACCTGEELQVISKGVTKRGFSKCKHRIFKLCTERTFSPWLLKLLISIRYISQHAEVNLAKLQKAFRQLFRALNLLRRELCLNPGDLPFPMMPEVDKLLLLGSHSHSSLSFSEYVSLCLFACFSNRFLNSEQEEISHVCVSASPSVLPANIFP